MKRIFWIALFAASLHAQAQTSHQVTLRWTASPDSTTATPGTVTVYRATAACPSSGIGTLTYSKLTAAALAGGPYVDTAVTSGITYCYYVTATIGGLESNPSNTFQGQIPVAAPTTLTGTVQ